MPRRTFLSRALTVLTALAVAFAAAGRPLAASAAPVGSITLDCRVNGVPLAYDTYGLACVADVTYDADAGTITSYQTRDAFASFGYDWPNMKASELDEAAKALAAFAGENDLYDLTSVSDASGRVGFWGLEPGLYLVARIAVADGNEGYACDPLLITIPLAEDGELTWAVNSTPKFEHPDDPDEPDKPDDPDEPDKPDDPGDPDKPGDPVDPGDPGDPDKPGDPWIPIVNTGDATFAGVGALLVLGGASVIVGGVIRSRSKDQAPASDDSDTPSDGASN